MENTVTNPYAKFNYDRLRNAKVLGNGKSNNNNHKNNKSNVRFVANGDPFPGLKIPRRGSFLVFTVRRYALHGICYRNSVCPSVCPSVCLSVTLVDCVHMVRPTIMIFSPQGSPIILVSGDITFISKFEGGHPERGR